MSEFLEDVIYQALSLESEGEDREHEEDPRLSLKARIERIESYLGVGGFGED